MGQCATICSAHNKQLNEVQVEPSAETKIIIKNKQLIAKFSLSPYFPKVVYLQICMKRYLKRRKYKPALKAPNFKSKTNNNNINVNINFNVNMTNNNIEHINKEQIVFPQKNNNNNNMLKPLENATTATTINNNNNNNNANDNEQNDPNAIVIPSVKAEFKESSLFKQDPFVKKTSNNHLCNKPSNNSNNPWDGPFDDVRRWYKRINEEQFYYEGEWKNGKRDGYGVLSWKDMSKYIGEFKDDKVNGFGQLWHEEGDTYTGYWNDFQAEGIGVYRTTRDASFQGYWLGDKQNGFGVEIWPKGSHYIGDYVNGFKHGIGTLNFEGSGGYEGEFVNGSIGGYGTFYFTDNRKYEGQWKNNKMHGFGIITWPDGKFFEGEFYEDKKEGFGVFYSEKKIYMGVWRNSQFEGDIIILEKGKVKKQNWKNGKLNKHLTSDKPIYFEKYINEILLNKEQHAKQIIYKKQA